MSITNPDMETNIITDMVNRLIDSVITRDSISRNLLPAFNAISMDSFPETTPRDDPRLAGWSPDPVILNFTNQRHITVTESLGEDLIVSDPPHPSVETQVIPEASLVILTTEEEACAENLREAMAIVFERKDDLGDGDYLELTNLLKSVYEKKDPINLKTQIQEIQQDRDYLEEEYFDVSKQLSLHKKFAKVGIDNLKAERDTKIVENNVLKLKLRECKKWTKAKILRQNTEIGALQEDIDDLRIDNDRMWGTKFHYQNRMVHKAEVSPELFTKKEKEEVRTIKKRKEMDEPMDLLDSLQPVKVHLVPTYENGNVITKLNIEITPYESHIGNLFNE